MSRPRSLILVLSILALPLTAEPSFGVERPGSTSQVRGNPAALFGRVAFSGDQGFVLWNDHQPGGLRWTIYGSRIASDGRLLDASGILMDDGFGPAWRAVDVVSAGGRWVALWYDGRAIRARKIDRNGAASEAVDVVAVAGLAGASAVSNGETILLTFSDSGTQRTILVSSELIAIREIPLPPLVDFTLLTDGRDYLRFGRPVNLRRGDTHADLVTEDGDVMATRSVGAGSLTWTGEDYIATRFGDRFVFVRRLPRDLSKTSAFIQVAPTSHYARAVQVVGEGDGTATVFWFASDSEAGPYQLFAARIDRENRVSEPVQIVELDELFTVTKTASGYLLLGGAMRIVNVGNDLTVINSTVPAGDRAMPQYHAEAVRDGASDLIAYIQHDADGVPRVMIGRRGGEARPVAGDGGVQFRPSIASNGTSALVTWTAVDSDGSGLALYAMPLTIDGTPAASDPIRVGDAMFRSHERSWLYEFDEFVRNMPAPVIWTGAYYLVAWSDGIDVRTARFLADGTLVDSPGRIPVPHRVQDRHYQPVLARSGGVVILGWVEANDGSICVRNCPPLSAIRAIRLDTYGFPADAVPFTIADRSYGGKLDVATNGEVALFTWSVVRGLESSSHGRAIHVHAGHPDHAVFSFEIPVSFWTSVAAHKDGFLITWTDGPLWYRQLPQRLLAMTVSRFGVLSEPREVVPAAGRAEFPVAWTLPGGNAAIGYERTAADTEMAPRLFFVPVDSDVPIRRRSQGGRLQ